MFLLFEVLHQKKKVLILAFILETVFQTYAFIQGVYELEEEERGEIEWQKYFVILILETYH